MGIGWDDGNPFPFLGGGGDVVTPRLIFAHWLFQFVCMGGTPQRMENFAYYIMKEIGYTIPTGTALKNISKQSHRFQDEDFFTFLRFLDLFRTLSLRCFYFY
jgi:hypothetical protein